MEFRLVDKKPQLWEETFFQTRKKVLVFGVWPWLLLLKAKALDGPVCSFSFVFSQGSGVWQRKRGCMGFEVVALSWPCGTSDELDYCYSTYCWTFMVYRKSCYLMVFWQWFFFCRTSVFPEPGVVSLAVRPSIWEAKAGTSLWVKIILVYTSTLWVSGEPGLHSEKLS